MTVDGETRVFGVVGDPVRQVRTPQFINEVFQARGLGIVCLPFHVSEQNFSTYWDGMKATGNVVGFGVTIPHKAKAWELCDTAGPGATRTGVVNVVRRSAQGGWHGENFDGLSFVNGLIAQGHDPRGHDVLMVGAGGAARAIGFALLDAGVARLSISNRTAGKADNLVATLKEQTAAGNVVAVGMAATDTASIIINATSLGMNQDDPLPIDPARLKPDQIVAEVVAKPEFTRLLREAEAIGCAVHSGLHMILNQMEIMADFVAGASASPNEKP